MIVLGKGDAQTRGSLDLNEFAFLIAAIHDSPKDAALGATRGGHQHIFSLKAVDLVGVSTIGAAWFAVANVLTLGLLVPRLLPVISRGGRGGISRKRGVGTPGGRATWGGGTWLGGASGQHQYWD